MAPPLTQGFQYACVANALLIAGVTVSSDEQAFQQWCTQVDMNQGVTYRECQRVFSCALTPKPDRLRASDGSPGWYLLDVRKSGIGHCYAYHLLPGTDTVDVFDVVDEGVLRCTCPKTALDHLEACELTHFRIQAGFCNTLLLADVRLDQLRCQ